MKIRYYFRGEVVYLDFRDETGKRYRVPSGASTEAEAKKAAPNIIARVLGKAALAVSTGFQPATVAKQGGMTLAQAYALGMKRRESWVDSKCPHTLEHSYAKVAEYFGADTPCAAITREMVNVWREKLRKEPGRRRNATLSNSSINHRLSMLTTLMEIADAPAHGVKHLSTKGNSRKRRISDREVSAMQAWLCANSGLQNALDMCDLITVGLETAAREGELLKLTWSNVTEDEVTFRDTKNGETRHVPLKPAVQSILDRRRKSHPVGGPFATMTSQRVVFLWASARKALGLEDDEQFVFHSLRHEAISRMVDRGSNSFAIQAIAGHSDIKTTQGYVTQSRTAMREAMGLPV
jgi:integrase